MRSVPVLAFLVSFISLLLSCKKDSAPENIHLSSDSVTLFAGQQTEVTISGVPAQYTVSSENGTIAALS